MNLVRSELFIPSLRAVAATTKSAAGGAKLPTTPTCDATNRTVSVELVADVVCPWCYIGHTRLQKAIALAATAGIAVDVRFTPFILRRQLPRAGIDKFDMFAAMFGSSDAVRKKYSGIARAALSEGLCFDPAEQLAGNSELAMRLLLWASDPTVPSHSGEAFTPLLQELFVRYNCRRIWIGNPDALLSAATAVGLPEQEVATILADEQSYATELETGLQRATRLGAHSVPMFVLGGDLSNVQRGTIVSGAVEVAELLAAIEHYVVGT